MLCVRQLTYCSEGWIQPCFCLYPIKDLDISKANNEFPKPDFGEDHWLYNFEDVYPRYQTFHVQLVIRKCEVVEN